MKKVIVSGCSGQLGLCLSKALIEDGNYVIGLDLVEPRFKSKLFEFHNVNICEKEQVDTFFKKLIVKHPVVNGLVNNAGTAVFSKFEDRTEDELKKVVELNMFAPIFMSQGFLSVAAGNYQSSIVNLASIYGLVAPDQGLYIDTPRNSSEIYGMTKAGIINLTKYLAVYLSEREIRCNCISPGGVKFKQGPKFIEAYSKKVPMSRMAEQGEIIKSILYLLDSDKASYVNGANLIVDGGFTAWN